MRSLSNREYEARLAWIRKQWNNPDRHDHYLMQIAQEVKRVLKKKPQDILLDHFKIPFSFSAQEKQEKRGPKTKEEAAQWAKVKWFGIVGATKELWGKLKEEKRIKRERRQDG